MDGTTLVKSFKVIMASLAMFLLFQLCYSCTIPQKASTTQLQNELMSKTWTLQAMVINNERVIQEADSLTEISFTKEDIQVVAYCYSFAGSYSLDKKGAFRTKVEALSKLTCEYKIDLFEQLLKRTVEKTEKVELKNNALYLFQDEQTFLYLK